MTPPDTTHEWPEYQAASEGQRLAALPHHSAWVEANAGSGKTKVLIDRVARILLTGVDPDSILCVTYTKAAASEMQSRLFERLGSWCVMEEETLKQALSKLENRPIASYTHTNIDRARQLFADALETPGGLRIETIHAFAGRVLRRFPLEAGIAPGFSELDDDDASDLWNAAFRELGRSVVRGDEKLVEAARCAAEAGGGKGFEAIRALLPRRAAIQRYIDQSGGMEPAIARLAATLQAPALSPSAMLEKAMSADLPRQALKDLLGALPTAKKSDADLATTLATVLSDASAEDRFTAYTSLAFTKSGDQRKSNPYTADAIKVAPACALFFQTKEIPQGSEIQRIYAIAEALNAARMFERSAALLRLASTLFNEFGERKRARAGLDFDDLIETTSHLLNHQHAAEWVLWKLDGGITHILLDEAQDTSPAQWNILRALTADIFAGVGAERKEQRTLFVVGDRKQSIYSFQGADPEFFLLQKQGFIDDAVAAKIDHEIPSLAMSFRSSPEVLDYVDAVFDTDVFTPDAPFTIAPPDAADVMRHTAFRRTQPGTVELWPLEPKSDVEPAEPWDAPREMQSAASPKAKLAQRIADFIRRELDTGAAVWDSNTQRPARPGDFLILVRGRTGGLFDGILQALKRRNIPVAGADRIQLLDSLPVQDLLNLVRFALCPEDDLTLAEILKGPFAVEAEVDGLKWMDDDALFRIANPRKGSLWSAVQSARLPVTAFLEDVLARRHHAPFEFLTHALERGQGLARPGWELILSRFGGPAREPVTALIDRAASFDAGEAPSLQMFLDAVERRGGEVKRELSGPQDEVRVMTVHGAKGLEAPIVILPDTCSAHRTDRDGVFITEGGAPIWAGPKTNDVKLSAELRAISEARALREHRRLLYVALTRAQDRLIVCGAFSGNPKSAGHAETSWYTVCQSAMVRLAATGRVEEIEDGDRTIRRFGAAPERLIPAAITTGHATTLPAWLTAPAPVITANRVLSPSRLVQKSEPPVISPFGPGRAERLRRGSLIHLLFEVLPELPQRSRRKAAETFLKKQPDLSADQRKEMLASTLTVLEDEQFGAVFAPGGRAEAPIIGPLNGATINGRVDRLVITDTEILVVDYKTDRPSPPTVEGVGEAYIAQMAAYRAVLAQRWPNRPIRCLLVWTDGPRLMEIPPSALDSALQAIKP